ncbi:MAG: hypothetical protein IJW00_03280 [Clostridia bacterium]|nr:hypothetical protein [Clostridia bacterium]
MKKSNLKRLLALLLCLLMVGTTFSLLVIPTFAEDVTVQNGTGSREPVRVGKTYSYRAIVNGEFTGFGFCMPTWTKTDSYATLSIYKWLGGYEKTIASEPIAKKEFNPLKDGQYHWVEFDPQPAGEYLFHISGGGADVGVWTNMSPTDSKGFLYLNGLEQRGEPELKIRMTNPMLEPFGNCEASGEIRNIKYPYTGNTGEAVFNMNGPFGMRLNVASSFVGLQFKMATYMATDMEVDMSVYAWKGTYDQTIAETPVATGRVKMVDNAMQGITFDEVPAGDYLFIAHNYNKAPAMYVYNTVENFKGYVYRDGFPVETGVQYPVMQIIFNEEKDEYFMECAKPQDAITGDHVAPPAYVIPEDSLIYTHPVMPDTWVFTDGLGRVSLTNADVGDLKDDKTLAMFYWTWHIDGFTNDTPANLQKLSEQYPDAMRDWDNQLWKDLKTTSYWWNESIYGFYRGDDKWVLRKQAELLTNAGVDVIFTDNTNAGMTWRNSYTPLMEEWTDAMEDGLKAPKVSFMLPFWDKDYTNTQLQSLYLDIFRANKWNNLWFYWEDKPMLMAIKESVNGSVSPIEKEISKFFTFRAGQPDYLYHPKSNEFGSWGWLSMYPQATYAGSRNNVKEGKVEQMTVGIAMNHDYENKVLAAMSGNHIAGRSYTSAYPDRYEKEGAEASKWGYNFAEQFDYALEVDPEVIFVTGWNEFRVGRYETWPEGSVAAVENAFPDQYNDEFSRDIEPTKGALKDHYYYQLVNYVRKFKGARAIPTPSISATIDLSAGQDQWKSVEPYYAAYIGNTEDRNAPGYGTLVYTETSGRNDIIGAQVARDEEYVYFHVECADNITPYTDNLWMTLYIDSDQTNQGWETFEYVINKSAASADTVVLEKFTGDGYASEKVADCAYTVDGRYMTVKVAKSDLGLSGNDYTINFSWTDNVHDEGDETKFSGDIMDFYISGDVAPGARFKYSYISTEANATGKEQETAEDTGVGATEEPTVGGVEDPETNVPAVTDGESETAAEGEGCQSSVAATAGAITTMAAAAMVLKKRKEEEA